MPIRRKPMRSVSSKLLPWSPPALESPREVTVTNDPATRMINLNSGEDCLITMPEAVSYVPNAMAATEDAIITVIGGRNVTIIGGEVNVDRIVQTTVSAGMASDGMVLIVASTAGFPQAGYLRINGEGMLYNSKTTTSFNITARNSGFYLGTGTPPEAHSAGSAVYLGEPHRGAFSFRSQTGFVHVEGVRIHGVGLLDGFRVRGSAATTVTIQNCHVGPNGPVEIVAMRDGHADGIQTWGAGVKALRVSHTSLLGGAAGRCIINAANTSGGGAVEKIYIQDSECVDYYGRRLSLVTNSDPETEWWVANSWLRTGKTRAVAAPEKGSLFGKDAPGGEPMVDPDTVGLGYVSPGYAQPIP